MFGIAVAFTLLSSDPSPSTMRDARFVDPMPGGVMAGYQGDTGLDIGGVRLPVYAIAAGTLDYAEWGHTRWRGPRDTAFCVRLALDTPVPYKTHKITHVYYAHMSALEVTQAEGSRDRRHVAGGEKLGTSGVANGSWHLHLGLLLDNQVEQDDWTYILREDEVRAALGGYKNGEKI